MCMLCTLLVNTVGGVDHADVMFPNHHVLRQLASIFSPRTAKYLQDTLIG